MAPYLLVPGLPLTAALVLVLGAVAPPPDAVAATAVARRVGLPSEITTIPQGESLLNDATAITAYKVALAAAVGQGASRAGGVEEFLVAALGGLAVGLILMAPIHWLRTRVREALPQNTSSLLMSFVAYAAAGQLRASGVIAVVVVALYGHRAWQVHFARRLCERWSACGCRSSSGASGRTRARTPSGTQSPAIAFSIPLTEEHGEAELLQRNLILFLTFTSVTLPALIRPAEGSRRRPAGRDPGRGVP